MSSSCATEEVAELAIRFLFPLKQLLMKKTINTYDRGKCYYVQLRKLVSSRESCSQAETQNSSTDTKVEVYKGGQIYTFPPGGSVSAHTRYNPSMRCCYVIEFSCSIVTLIFL